MPAPVSPVSTVKPRVELEVERFDDDEIADGQEPEHAKRREQRLLAAQPFRRLAPVQLLAQHREVVVALGVQEARRVRRAPHGDALAFGQREMRLAVAMQRGVAAALAA